MTDETAQKIWDACLIKSWREFRDLYQTLVAFESIAGARIDQFNLFRTPCGVPCKVGVRSFVAQRLPKLNDRLHAKGREHDVALLRSLQQSKYTTATQNLNPDREHAAARRNVIKNQAKIALDVARYSERNRSTDWRVTK